MMMSRRTSSTSRRYGDVGKVSRLTDPFGPTSSASNRISRRSRYTGTPQRGRWDSYGDATPSSEDSMVARFTDVGALSASSRRPTNKTSSRYYSKGSGGSRRYGDRRRAGGFSDGASFNPTKIIQGAAKALPWLADLTGGGADGRNGSGRRSRRAAYGTSGRQPRSSKSGVPRY